MKNLILAFVALFSLNVLPQEKLTFDFDYAQFSYDTLSNRVEIYYSVNQNAFKKENSQISMNFILTIKNIDDNKLVVNKEWPIDKATDTSNTSLVGLLNVVLPKGRFHAIFKVVDQKNSAIQKTLSDTIRVNPLDHTNFSMSSIQLASQILPESKSVNALFYKNSYEVRPIPTALFGASQPALFYYLELYNLFTAGQDHNLKIISTIVSSKNKKIFEKSKMINTKVDNRVEVGTIPVHTYPTGSYTLIITLVDSVKNFGVSSYKKFFVYNPDVKVEDVYASNQMDATTSIFGSMSEEELDDIYNKSKYLASKAENESYSALNNVEGKRDFLFRFWAKRDQDLTTVENENLQLYLHKIETANARYRTMQKDGWKTDRGRVFLMYGEPSEIDRYPNQLDTKPYEIWRYNEIEGGVVFVFADLTGFSDYQLLHSTLRGEMQDMNWENRIKTL